MALSDITQRTNNERNACDSTASSIRQPTLFDALSAMQRRNKRQRQPTAVGRENTSSNNDDIYEEKLAKRVCLTPPKPKRTAEPTYLSKDQIVNLGGLHNKHQEKQNHLACSRQSRRLPFALYSIHTAVHERCHRPIASCNISTFGRLASLVSPSAHTFQLQADDESQVNVLPLACKYSNTIATRGRLALVDESGRVSLFNTLCKNPDPSADTDGLRPILQWKAHDNSVFDLEWSPNDSQIVTASADETCRLWDAERQLLLGTFSGHTQTVRSLSWQHGSEHCFLSASRDGSIMTWDVRCNKTAIDGSHVHRPVNTIARAHHDVRCVKKTMRGKHSVVAGSVTAIKHLCHNTNMIASTGSTNEIVKYWDMRMTAPTRGASALPVPAALSLCSSRSSSLTVKRSRGIASLSLDPDGTRLYAACNDNSVYVHNALAPGHPIAQLNAPEFECNNFNIGTSMSPCGSHLAAGSASGCVIVWELDRYGCNSSRMRAVLEGHDKEAGCIAWYPGKDQVQLATSGDDGTLRVWDINTQLAEEGKADPMRKYQWGFSTTRQANQ
ncbi:hypothetical protein GGI25_000927 [Coemansia spiralis]|uniref:WD40 repeat-like protein n=2 Tax=Coemansia TaxID=4863 RepID=A0A9W8G6E3_9FUNG|nr:WD40-repeat-containing domain protein [Coemansia spiralis]KAJ1993785.1 hypothetical protein EDC05_001945 [Coemansia umbellata]KAJ2623161.1 hypothetical protein GGI26_002575 [Coemansia sp. RSA 1358]KAJ2680039.1 hypothetical protein GGI25_000927 [Coemansia spiralis]